jgi:hypothetical protein
MGANRVAAAQVALDHHVVLAVIQRTAERTGGLTSMALDTLVLVKLNSPGLLVARQSVDQTRFDAGRIVTVQADHRGVELFPPAGQRIDTTAAGLITDLMSEGAGQLASTAPYTQTRDHYKT